MVKGRISLVNKIVISSDLLFLGLYKKQISKSLGAETFCRLKDRDEHSSRCEKLVIAKFIF